MRLKLDFNQINSCIKAYFAETDSIIKTDFGSVSIIGSGGGVPKGGTTGQIIRKLSDEDYDAGWVDFPNVVTSVNGQTGDVEIIGLPSGGNIGDILMKGISGPNAYWTAPANSVEQDNTLPITAAAVYREVGNIQALLAIV